MIRNCKGITLTALVITVIVLSIIAAVTLYTTTDSNIAGEAKQATKDFDNAYLKQIIDNIYLSERNKYNSGLITEENMIYNIRNAIDSHEKLQNAGVTYSQTNTELIVTVGDNNLNYKIKDVELIQFTIDGTTYQAEKGMTWTEWCASSYNPASRFRVVGRCICV